MRKVGPHLVADPRQVLRVGTIRHCERGIGLDPPGGFRLQFQIDVGRQIPWSPFFRSSWGREA
jgi:hypothetical protein